MILQDKPGFLPDLPQWVIWISAILIVSFQLGGYPVLNNNEGLYAEIPREMLASGHWQGWVIPHLNGLAYMEKPPLLYWLTAICMALFGESETVIRLVPAASALVCVGLLLWFGRQIQREVAAKLAALMFVSGLGVMVMSRSLMFDMLLTACLLGGVMHAWLYHERHELRYACRSLIFLALAILAKGFVATILFTAIGGGYLLFKTRSLSDTFKALGMWFRWQPWLLFLIVVLPWHIAAMFAEPIFAWFYFINEHILRFMGKREPHDYYAGAWWYYLPRMALFLFPWTLMLPVLLRLKRVMPTVPALHAFLAAGWIMPLLFFSISSAKANYYLVTVMPLLALQIACWLEETGGVKRSGALILGAICAVLALALFVSAGRQTSPELLALGLTAANLMQFFASVFVLIAITVIWMAFRRPAWAMLPLIILPIAIAPVLVDGAKNRSAEISTRVLVEYSKKHFADRELILYRVFEQQSSLPFYLKRPVRVVDSRSSDLYWGNKLHKNAIVIDDQKFVDALKSQKLALIVLDEDQTDFDQKSYSTQMKRIARLGKASVFSN